jgi:hypothetical protein
MDFNQPLDVVGTGRSSACELWAGVANNDTPSPASPQFTVGWEMAGKGEYLLSTPAQSSRVDEWSQKCVLCTWSICDQILKFVKNSYHK